MPTFEELPPELICQILSFLPLQDLRALRLASEFWNEFFHRNEAPIYHHAAVQHNFVDSIHVSLEDAIKGQGKYLYGVETWRALCQRRFMLESNWARYGTHLLKVIAKEHPDVHRLKTDEERGIVMTTHADGGLVVRDMDTGDVLWGLPRTYVRSYAHCEYGNGFLIFDRLGQSKEVWRLASEYERSPFPADEFQEEISFTINQYIPPSKGNFKPWALLNMPELGRAFRFVYPTLLVAGFTRAYLYDIESGQLIQTIQNTQVVRDGATLGDINYVELSPLHALICGSIQLRVFGRQLGNLLYSLSRTDALDCVHVAVDDTITASQDVTPDVFTTVPIPLHRIEEWNSDPDAEFIAVHASPDGKTVVALLSDSRLVIFKDIVRLSKGEASLRECAAVIHLACPQHSAGSAIDSAVYLAFEYGRISVVTTLGVFIVTLDSTLHGLEDPWTKMRCIPQDASSASIRDSPYPDMIICRILPLTKREYLKGVTCLQMTRSRLFLTWNPSIIPSSTTGSQSDADENEEPEDEFMVNDAAQRFWAHVDDDVSLKAIVYLNLTPEATNEA